MNTHELAGGRVVQVAPDWRSIGAKKWGKGHVIRGDKRAYTSWAIHVGLIQWPTKSFWRVGLCVERNGETCEVEHVRYATEQEAFDAVSWLAVIAPESAIENWKANRAAVLGWSA